MEQINVQVCLKHPKITLKYFTREAAGFDLHCIEECTLLPYQPVLVKTGLGLRLPKGFTGFIKGRSSMASKGVNVFQGVVDSDYVGEINLVLCNITDRPIIIEAFQRVAQLVLLKYYQAIFVPEVFESSAGKRIGGFGSTGV